MTQQLAVFNFHGLTVRTIDVDGELFFVAGDVAEVLGYSTNPSRLFSHVPDEWKGVHPIHTPGGKQEMLTLSEPGLFFFLNRSDKPAALPMQKWVAGEVLPSIRKTGGYSMQPQELIARAVIEAQRMIDNQAAQIAELAPKAAIADRIAVADGLYNLTHAAKVIGVPPRTFNNQLHSMGWIYRMGVKGSWTGSAPKVKAGYIEHKVHQFEHSDWTPDSSPQVFITAKGIHRLASIFNVELPEAA